MTQSEAIDFARQYLWDQSCYAPDGNTHLSGKHGGKNCLLNGTIEDFGLHRNLQYMLCGAYQRLEATFGTNEVTKKDIALAVEAWFMGNTETEHAIAQGESNLRQKGERYVRLVRNHALVHKNEPTVIQAYK